MKTHQGIPNIIILPLVHCYLLQLYVQEGRILLKKTAHSNVGL